MVYRKMVFYICTTCENILIGGRIMNQTQLVTDRQTDGQTDNNGRTICYPPDEGIITAPFTLLFILIYMFLNP